MKVAQTRRKKFNFRVNYITVVMFSISLRSDGNYKALLYMNHLSDDVSYCRMVDRHQCDRESVEMNSNYANSRKASEKNEKRL